MNESFVETERRRVNQELPKNTFRLGIIGDTSDLKSEFAILFYFPKTPNKIKRITENVSKAIVENPLLKQIILVTGGTSGVPEHFASVFGLHGRDHNVFHILPKMFQQLKPNFTTSPVVGQTIYAGNDMNERRAIFGSVCNCYIVIGGGPGSSDEIRHAINSNKFIIPIACSGGASSDCFKNHLEQQFPDWGTPKVGIPHCLNQNSQLNLQMYWKVISDPNSNPNQVSTAISMILELLL